MNTAVIPPTKPINFEQFNIINEYVADGLTVRTYAPNLTEAERAKTNIEIRERIVDIVSGLDNYDMADVVNL